MRASLPGGPALLALLLLLLETRVSAEELRCVASGPQFLAALANATDRILLEDNIYVTPEAAKAHQLPLVLTRNMTIGSFPGSRHTLDFGNTYSLLRLELGAELVLSDLRLQGVPTKDEGRAAGLGCCEMTIGPLWPTAEATPNHQVTLKNVAMLALDKKCTANLMEAEAWTVRRIMGRIGTVYWPCDSLSDPDFEPQLTMCEEGTLHNFALPITDIATMLPVGNAYYTFTNFTLSCELPGRASASAATAAPAPVSGGATQPSAWAWALIGVALGVVAAASAALVLRWRQQRQRTQHCSETSGSLEVGRLPPLVTTAKGPAEYWPAAEPSAYPPPVSPRQPMEEVSMLGAAMWNSRVGPIEDLELGELVGRGSFGRCYKGRWKGAVVAAKVIDQRVQEGKSYDLSREPLLSLSVSHPHVVQAFKLSLVCIKPFLRLCGSSEVEQRSSRQTSSEFGKASPQPGGSGALRTAGCQALGSGATAAEGGSDVKEALVSVPGSRGWGGGEPPSTPRSVAMSADLSALTPGDWEIWLIMDYCDRGSLSDAIRERRFFLPGTSSLNMVPLVLSLLDTALGMEYLHTAHIVHGDLKARNVLLKTARNDRRGFICRVADFGLSRMLEQNQTHVDNASWGTATHAAPELLQTGRLMPAADVFSFAMIMWEMVAGRDVYEDESFTTFQIIHSVSTDPQFRPAIPSGCPAELAHLMQRCWTFDPMLRPSFAEIVRELCQMRRELMMRASSDLPRPRELLGGAAGPSTHPHPGSAAVQGGQLGGALRMEANGLLPVAAPAVAGSPR